MGSNPTGASIGKPCPFLWKEPAQIYRPGPVCDGPSYHMPWWSTEYSLLIDTHALVRLQWWWYSGCESHVLVLFRTTLFTSLSWQMNVILLHIIPLNQKTEKYNKTVLHHWESTRGNDWTNRVESRGTSFLWELPSRSGKSLRHGMGNPRVNQRVRDDS